MKNKKKIVITISIMLLVTLIVLIGINKKEIKLDEVKLKEIQAYDNKNVSIMIPGETESGWQKYTGEGFPERSRYAYSSEDSKCLDTNSQEIEGTLEYANGKVKIKTNKTIYCYIYFKEGKKLTINKGEGIERYWYKINNESEYVESNTREELAVIPGSKYYYYGEASEGYIMNTCTSEEDSCEGTMDNEDTEITVSPAPRYTLTINYGPGVKNIYYKVNGASTYKKEEINSSANGNIVIPVNNGTEYTYYAETNGDYATLSNCYDNSSHSCNGMMDNTNGKIHSIIPLLQTGESYIREKATSSVVAGENGIIINSGLPETEQTGSNVTQDWRYIGPNPDNYVCLGELNNDGSCEDEEHLYRIIGVIPTQSTVNGTYQNRVKLIKYKLYIDNDVSTNGKYLWTGQRNLGESNYTSFTGISSVPSNWEESTLNRKILNGEIYGTSSIYTPSFYASLEEKQCLIDNVVWYLGSTIKDYSSISGVQYYKYERGNNTSYSNPINTIGRIGLPYVSDYSFSSSGSESFDRSQCLGMGMHTSITNWSYCIIGSWFQPLFFIDTKEKASVLYSAFKRNGAGYVTQTNIVDDIPIAVSPTFHLNNSIKITNGNGTILNPYTLSN